MFQSADSVMHVTTSSVDYFKASQKVLPRRFNDFNPQLCTKQEACVCMFGGQMFNGENLSSLSLMVLHVSLLSSFLLKVKPFC